MQKTAKEKSVQETAYARLVYINLLLEDYREQLADVKKRQSATLDIVKLRGINREKTAVQEVIGKLESETRQLRRQVLRVV